MPPVIVASFIALDMRSRVSVISVEPLLYVIVIELLRPQHPRKSLALDIESMRRRGLKKILLRRYSCNAKDRHTK